LHNYFIIPKVETFEGCFRVLLVDPFKFVSIACNAVYLALCIFAGLMKIQVKVEEVLMLLELFMEVEVILMRKRLVCA
jgi:hypothetical protein